MDQNGIGSYPMMHNIYGRKTRELLMGQKSTW